jgi:hypothetical protein
MLGRISLLSVATVILASGLAGSSVALPIAPLNQVQVGDSSNVIQVAQKKGGGNKAAKSHKAAPKASKSAKSSKTVKSSKSVKASKHVNTKHVNKTVVHRTVVVRPYRAWYARPYYGAVIAGVTLGTIVLVSTPRVVPVAPAPNLCWFWSNQEQLNGYWDYCTPPL